MEKRFDLTDFEQSLKEHANHFTMVPSKRMWHSIYNDLHPGSKWPSAFMTLILMFSFIGISHLNSDNLQSVNIVDSKLQSPVSAMNVATLNDNKIERNKKKPLKVLHLSSRNVPVSKSIAEYVPAKRHGNELNLLTESSNAGKESVGNKREQVSSNHQSISGNTILRKEKTISPIDFNLNGGTNPKTLAASFVKIDKTLPITFTGKEKQVNESETNKVIFLQNEGVIADIISPNAPSFLPKNTLINKIEKGSEISQPNTTKKIEELQQAILQKQKNKKVKWVYFVTPTISTVYFNGKPSEPDPGANFSSVVTRPNDIGNYMLYNAKLGIKAGIEFQYAFSPKWQLLTGTRLVYSGYNIISNHVHPTYASLLLKDELGAAYAKNYITHFGNGQGGKQVPLHNYSIQLGLPVGLGYTIWDNNRVQINIASTVEPSVLLKGNSYLLSSEGRNYVNDPGLLRKVNISGNFATFISFRSYKLEWQIGPSVRYQVLSTYKDIYPVKEHLIDYGIKIGISK